MQLCINWVSNRRNSRMSTNLNGRSATVTRSRVNGKIFTAVGGLDPDPVLLFDNRSSGFPPSLLTLGEVAGFLKISIPGVRRLQQRRLIPFIKVGGSVRFSPYDVLSYVEKQRVAPIG